MTAVDDDDGRGETAGVEPVQLAVTVPARVRTNASLLIRTSASRREEHRRRRHQNRRGGQSNRNPGKQTACQDLSGPNGGSCEQQEQKSYDDPGERRELHPRRSCKYSTSLSIGSRSCSIESRSRTVTCRSANDSKSTVTQ